MALERQTRFSARMLDLAQGCGGPAEFRVEALRELRRVVGCTGAVYRRGAHWRGATVSYLDLDHPARINETYLAQEQRFQAELRPWGELGRGRGVNIDSEVYPAQARRRMAFYADVIGPARVRSVMGCPLWFRGQYLGLILLLRTGRDQPFTRDQSGALEPLLPAMGLAEAALQPTAAVGGELADFRQAFAGLSPRERQVAGFLARGLQSKEIATALGTSPETVRKQTLRVFQRLGLHGRTQVAIAMHQAGMLPDR